MDNIIDQKKKTHALTQKQTKQNKTEQNKKWTTWLLLFFSFFNGLQTVGRLICCIRVQQKNATICLFASHFGYAYGVGDKSTARSSVRAYLIGCFIWCCHSDYFFQRRQLPAQIHSKGLHFSVLPKMQICLHECEKSMRHWLIAYPIRLSQMGCK